MASKADSYDDALAESVIGLFKTEVIRRKAGAVQRDPQHRRDNDERVFGG